MRRGGIPYDQLQKTNMYGSNDNNAADLEDRYAEHNADGAAAAGGKKKKKGRKRPKVNIEGTGSMNPDVMEESMHSNLDDGRSGHSENRRFFEDQMARVTGSIKASNDASMELQNPKAYQEKGDSQLNINKRGSAGSMRSRKSSTHVSVQMEDVETGSMSKIKKMNTRKVGDGDGEEGQGGGFIERLRGMSGKKKSQESQNLNVLPVP